MPGNRHGHRRLRGRGLFQRRHQLQYSDEPKFEASVGTLEAWQAVSGLDGNSVTFDPGFADLDPANPALSPASLDSPLVGGGHPTLSCAQDITGADRDAAPDIGAFEFRP